MYYSYLQLGPSILYTILNFGVGLNATSCNTWPHVESSPGNSHNEHIKLIFVLIETPWKPDINLLSCYWPIKFETCSILSSIHSSIPCTRQLVMCMGADCTEKILCFPLCPVENMAVMCPSTLSLPDRLYPKWQYKGWGPSPLAPRLQACPCVSAAAH